MTIYCTLVEVDGTVVEGMADSARQKWFAHMMQIGLEEKVVTPALLVGFVSPDVLAHHLPPELLSKLLASALAAGAMTPERLLETLTPEVLAENIPHEVIWKCIEAGAERTGIASDK
jgi:hypothetical protein